MTGERTSRPILQALVGPETFGETYTGDGTYYDSANGSGACMFDPSPNDMDIAATDNCNDLMPLIFEISQQC